METGVKTANNETVEKVPFPGNNRWISLYYIVKERRQIWHDIRIIHTNRGAARQHYSGRIMEGHLHWQLGNRQNENYE